MPCQWSSSAALVAILSLRVKPQFCTSHFSLFTKERAHTATAITTCHVDGEVAVYVWIGGVVGSEGNEEGGEGNVGEGLARKRTGGIGGKFTTTC